MIANAQTPARYDPEQLEGLPEHVRRYFHFALKPGQPMIARARIAQRGEFANKPNRWAKFTATETFTTQPPGFSWDAKISMAPLLSMHVRDGYQNGEGALVAKILGVLPVANEHGNAQVNAGELMRYLSELPYLPTAMLPGNGVHWTAIDDEWAQATLVDSKTRVCIDVRIDERGAMVEVEAERYFLESDGSATLRPWHGRWLEYTQASGMMIPKAGEVSWLLPSGPFPYWRATTRSAEYDFSA